MQQRQRKREVLQRSRNDLLHKKKKTNNNQVQEIVVSEHVTNTDQMEEDKEEDYEDIEDVNEDYPNTDIEDEEEDEFEEEEVEVQDEQEKKVYKVKNNNVEEIPQQKSTLKRKNQNEAPAPNEKRAWFNDGIQEEHLDFDNKAYNMLHRINTEWPCLSCDIVLTPEEQEQWRQKQHPKMNQYPYTVYLAAGTQAAQPSKNCLYLMKLSKLHKTKHDDDSDHDDEEDVDILNDEDGEVQMESVVGLRNGVNRIRTMCYQPIVAYWSENGDVVIANLKSLYDNLQQESDKKNRTHNINQLQHRSFSNSHEGFALDWNQTSVGVLASGSVDGKIFTYAPKDSSDFVRDTKPYTFHQQSVEDICWSPAESFAFASCGVDGTVQVCDTRVGTRNKSQLLIKAHDTDVNVITWNSVATNLLASGAEDGCFKVWDLRFPDKDSISEIVWHSQQITSIQFQPYQDSTIAVSSADNKLSIWDFAVENEEQGALNDEVPDQLLFVHQGQKDLKELRYHPLYYEMLVSTSATGFNIFKPTLDEEEEASSESEDDEKHEIQKIHEKDLDEYLSKLSLNDQ